MIIIMIAWCKLIISLQIFVNKPAKNIRWRLTFLVTRMESNFSHEMSISPHSQILIYAMLRPIPSLIKLTGPINISVGLKALNRQITILKKNPDGEINNYEIWFMTEMLPVSLKNKLTIKFIINYKAKAMVFIFTT